MLSTKCQFMVSTICQFMLYTICQFCGKYNISVSDKLYNLSVYGKNFLSVYGKNNMSCQFQIICTIW